MPQALRKTRAVCNECVAPIDAVVTEVDGAIYLVKTCPEHGEQRVRLSQDAPYFRDLHDFFFDVMPPTTPQRDFIIRLTDRCNLDCSICLASANLLKQDDYPLDKLIEFVREHPKSKLDLMGCEPTVREDLPEVIRELRKHKCIVAVHTNGIKLADRDYLKELIDAGLGEVHFQFDGLDDRYYQDIRSKPLADNKLEVLKALGEFDVATDLRATTARVAAFCSRRVGFCSSTVADIRSVNHNHRKNASAKLEGMTFAARRGVVAREV